MLFAVLCTDKPNALQVRMDTRPRARRLSRRSQCQGRAGLRRAVPRRRRQAEWQPGRRSRLRRSRKRGAIAAADPYAKAGLFANVEIKPWNWVFNKPEA